MASRRRTLPESTEVGDASISSLASTSASASASTSKKSRNVAAPLFLDQSVRIKEEDELDELFGQSDLSGQEPDDQEPSNGNGNGNGNVIDNEQEDELMEDGEGENTGNVSTSTRGAASRRTTIKPKKPAATVKAPFKLGAHLNAPRSITLSCDILRKRVMSGTVDVNPEYQRDSVWSGEKQSALIDSIFRQYYVPPILFSRVETGKPGIEEEAGPSDTAPRREFNPTINPSAKKTTKKSSKAPASGSKRKRPAADEDSDFDGDDDDDDDDDDEDDEADGSLVDKYVCIDGKQRLSSIINFMNNHIPIKDPKTKRPYWFIEDPSTKKQGIPLKLKKKFEDSQITCVEYSSLSVASEREMFSRVQMGVTLSVSEKLKAQPGNWNTKFRELCLKYMRDKDDDGNPLLGSVVDCKRSNDHKCVMQIALLIMQKDNPSFIPTTSECQKWSNSEEARTAELDKIAKALEDTLALFAELVKRGDKGALPEAQTGGKSHRRNLAPIEFVYMSLFLWGSGAKLNKKYPDVLTSSLLDLRAHVRSRHTDIMWKPVIAQDYRTFIKSERGRLIEKGYIKTSKDGGEKKKQKKD